MNKDDVTGDGDEAVAREIALSNMAEQTGCISRSCESRRTVIIVRAVREALARGRELGVREAEDALRQIRDVAFSAREFRTGKVPTPVHESCDHFGCIASRALTAIEARRAGRGE